MLPSGRVLIKVSSRVCLATRFSVLCDLACVLAEKLGGPLYMTESLRCVVKENPFISQPDCDHRERHTPDQANAQRNGSETVEQRQHQQ